MVEVRGDPDLESLADQRLCLQGTAAAVPVLVLELSAVTFADSTCLNLLPLMRQAADRRLVGVPRPGRGSPTVCG
ncbi:hypothetical protein J8N05_45985 [Streptomyces sp. BH-SS-21]|uniref:STAS domain-containing protein n=1 Tax=Streptomyces liliiviolaceus TaxID=2823109 RepID=A0A941BC06_9ACTN|nr:hypothetical protein [Streptomyces liliiviolaceus]MBQ0855521.1 hypothetical protein [Streptomyces liliiviolaceus]